MNREGREKKGGKKGSLHGQRGRVPPVHILHMCLFETLRSLEQDGAASLIRLLPLLAEPGHVSPNNLVTLPAAERI